MPRPSVDGGTLSLETRRVHGAAEQQVPGAEGAGLVPREEAGSFAPSRLLNPEACLGGKPLPRAIVKPAPGRDALSAGRPDTLQRGPRLPAT